MEASQESVTDSLAAAAAAKTVVESEVRGSDSKTQKDDMNEEHDGLVKGCDDETQKGDLKEEHDGLVKGSDGKGGQMNGQIDSSDVPVVDVRKNVLETEMVSVEDKEEVQDIDGLNGGKEAEKEIDSSDCPVVETQVASVQEKKEVVQDLDGLEIVNEAEKGINSAHGLGVVITKNVVENDVISVEEKEEVQDMDGLEGVKEVEKEIESGLRIENVGKNGVHENGVHKVGEQEMNVDAEKSNNSDEEVGDEEVGDAEEHEFAVGDFVWGKIKSYPWWPGQIYDPSDASKYAENHMVKGCLLVAYFGDDSFSWCRKSQLKRFAENFDEMSKQSKNSNFLHAVSDALEEFSRAVEMEIRCLSLPMENHVWDFKARNRGIKAGIIVPRGDYMKLFIARLEPEQLLRNLRHAAKTGTAGSPLEIRVLKSWLAGYYRSKGGYALAKFHEPMPIEGLEDKMGYGVSVLIQGPADEEMTGIQASEDKVYQRKRKSVAEIMEEDMVGIELMHSMENIEKPRSKKMRKRYNKSESGGDSSVKKSSGKRGRKRKEETMTKSPESVQNGDTEKGETDGKEETLESFASRRRKKSKYLSPPYTTPLGTTSKVGERMTKVAGQLIGSPSILTSCSSPSNKKRSDDIDVNEVLSVISNVAVDPMHLRGKENLDQITGFVSAFRSSMYSDGPTNLSDALISEEFAQAGGMKTKIKEEEVCLLITFPPSFTLPSKDNLFDIFGKFGELNETETDLYPNSFSAQVAFVRKSDAEEAYNGCLKNSFFGEGNVNYRLLYPGRKASSARKKTGKSESTGLGLITEKLEKLTSEVKSWDGEVTGEMKRKLEGELKELVTEVSILPQSSP